MEPTILHADLDAFYASVEQLVDLTLRGRPVLVDGGVVVAASYEARAHGVRAPMPTRDALALCPDARVVDGHFGLYLELSERVMGILEDATPVLEQISVDEAFLDVTGAVHLLGSPSQIARHLRERVQREVGLPLSVGVASTKFLAKIASARAKPDGLVVVEIGEEIDFLHPLPVEALWGVGRVTASRLHDLGIYTIGELAAVPRDVMSVSLGPAASSALHALSWNLDPRPVRGGRRAGSVGSQQALGRGLFDREEMAVVILGLADRVGRRLRAKSRSGRTLTLRLRADGRTLTRSHTLSAATNSTMALADLAVALLDRGMESITAPVTLIGISVSGLVTGGAIQLELPLDEGSVGRPGSLEDLKRQSLDTQVDLIRERFGRPLLSFGLNQGGDDDFRRLAERS